MVIVVQIKLRQAVLDVCLVHKLTAIKRIKKL